MTGATLRRVHASSAILVAPTILFFALTGALQLFDLHHPHGDYRPPPVVVALASLHTDGVFAMPRRREAAAEAKAGATAAGADPASDTAEAAALPTRLLRFVFLAATVVLAFSTALGLVMAFGQTRRTRLRWLLLACGLLIPSALAALTSAAG